MVSMIKGQFPAVGALVVASGLVSATGNTLADAAPNFVEFILSFAGGAGITMVADTMLPGAYKNPDS